MKSWLLACAFLTPVAAYAQSAGGFASGAELPAASLNSAFANKADLGKTTATVPSNAALQALPVNQFSSVYRAGYYAPNDGGGAFYNSTTAACPLNAGAGDGGSQVAPLSGGGCWVADLPQSKINVKIWGASGGSGTTPGTVDTAPLLADACAAAPGRTLYLPAGLYLINSPFSLTSVCNFTGDGWGFGAPSANNGTWFYTNNTAISPVTFGGGSTGSRWERFGVYQSQPVPSGNTYTPTTYPYFVTLQNTSGKVELNDIMLFGVYDGIQSLAATGQTKLNKIWADCWANCIYFDGLEDVSLMDDIHIWPFFNNSNAGVKAYHLSNSDAIISGRNDTPEWGRIFVLGDRSAVKLIGTSAGITTGLSIADLDCDTEQYCLWLTNTANGADVKIAQAYMAGGGVTPANASAVEIDSDLSTVWLGNIKTIFESCNAINMTNTTGGNVVYLGSLYDQDGNESSSSSCNSSIQFASSSTLNRYFGATYPYIVGGNYAAQTGTTAVFNPGNTIMDTPGVLPWTPKFASAGGGGTATYSVQTGTVVAQGGSVTVTFNLTIASGFSGFSGNMNIVNLPYSSSSTLPTSANCSIGFLQNVTYTGYATVSGIIPANYDGIQLVGIGGTSESGALPTSAFTNGSAISGSCTYARY